MCVCVCVYVRMKESAGKTMENPSERRSKRRGKKRPVIITGRTHLLCWSPPLGGDGVNSEEKVHAVKLLPKDFSDKIKFLNTWNKVSCLLISSTEGFLRGGKKPQRIYLCKFSYSTFSHERTLNIFLQRKSNVNIFVRMHDITMIKFINGE